MPSWQRFCGRIPTWVAFGLVAIAAGVFPVQVSRTLTAPLHDTLSVVPDDAFYYLKIARNIAGGLGSTFDGENPTNGYHPLWMACLVVLARLTNGGVPLVHAAQAIGFVLHLVGAVLVWQLGRGVGPKRWAMACAAVWLASPWGVLQATQGMEASLYQATAFALLLAHRALLTNPVPEGRHFGVYAATMAAVALARTDGVVLCAVASAALVFQWRRRNDPPPRLEVALVGAVAAAGAVWAVWGAISIWLTGTVVQDSAAMKQLWHANAAALSGEPTGALQVLTGVWLAYPIALLSGGIFVPPAIGVAKALLIATIGLAFLGRRHGDAPWPTVFVTTGWACLTGIAFGGAMVDLQLWHMPSGAVGTFVPVLLLGPAAANQLRRWLPHSAAPILALLSTVVACGIVYGWAQGLRLRAAPYPWQPDVYASLDVFGRHLVPGDRTGSFNAGIPGYFADYPVVNLDGLVNHSVVTYWRQGRWSEYVEAAGITHLADESESLARAQRFSDRPLTLEELDDHALRVWPSGRRVLWKVLRGADARQPALAGTSSAENLVLAPRP